MTMGEKRWKKPRPAGRNDAGAGGASCVCSVWSVAMHNALTNGFQLHIGFCD